MPSRTVHVVCGFVIAAGLLSVPPGAQAGKKYALIVGVKTYRAGQPLPALSYTEHDAQRLAGVLEKSGFTVTLMTQAEAKQDGKEAFAPHADFIRDQLGPLLSNPFLKPDDLVLVALAGHGVQYGMIEGATTTPRFYFCPADADLRNDRAAGTTRQPLIASANEITARNHLIDLNELYDALRNCRAGGKLLLVDACRNDPSRDSGSRAAESITLPAIPPPPGGVAAFFSCSAHEKAIEDVDLKHGVFFHYVIEALEGAADSRTAAREPDRLITLSEITEHVSGNVYDFVRVKYGGASQRPELKGEFRGVMPIAELPTLTRAAPSAAFTAPPAGEHQFFNLEQRVLVNFRLDGNALNLRTGDGTPLVLHKQPDGRYVGRVPDKPDAIVLLLDLAAGVVRLRGENDARELVLRKVSNQRSGRGEIEPMAVGNFWIYEVTDDNGEKRLSVTSIARRTDKDGRRCYEYTVDGEPSLSQFDEKDAIFIVTDTPAGPEKMMPHQPRAGDRWVHDGRKSLIRSVTAPIDTPWGRLECVELAYTYRGTVEVPFNPAAPGNCGQEDAAPAEAPVVNYEERELTEMYYYHPGIGCVLKILNDSTHRLIGFHLEQEAAADAARP